MSAARVFVGLVLMLSLSACSGGTGTSSACPQPTIAVSPDPALSGAALEVTGTDWITGCDDNSVSEREVPVETIRIELITQSGTTLLGVASASGNPETLGQFTASYTLPRDVAGSGKVRALGDGFAAEATVTIRSAD